MKKSTWFVLLVFAFLATWFVLLVFAFLAYCLLRKKREDEQELNEN